MRPFSVWPILLLVLTNQITASRFLSGINNLIRLWPVKADDVELINTKECQRQFRSKIEKFTTRNTRKVCQWPKCVHFSANIEVALFQRPSYLFALQHGSFLQVIVVAEDMLSKEGTLFPPVIMIYKAKSVDF